MKKITGREKKLAEESSLETRMKHKPWLISIAVGVVFLGIVTVFISIFFGHAILDPVVLNWKLSSLSKNSADWERRELKDLGISISAPSELIFSEQPDTSSFKLGTEYKFELPKTKLRHAINFDVTKNFTRQLGSYPQWVEDCEQKLQTSDTSSEIHWVECGDNSNTFFIHTPTHKLRMGVGTWYSHPDHSQKTQDLIKEFAEKMLETMEVSTATSSAK
jgi:hypothetical protein